MIIYAYQVRAASSNEIDNIVLRRPDDDVIYTDLRLVLPQNYTLGETHSGEPAIYDEMGEYVSLCLGGSRRSIVFAVSATRRRVVKQAPRDGYVVPLREARLAAGLTVKQLSDASGVYSRQIQSIEAGRTFAGNMSARNLLALADAIGVDIRTLIDKDD